MHAGLIPTASQPSPLPLSPPPLTGPSRTSSIRSSPPTALVPSTEETKTMTKTTDKPVDLRSHFGLTATPFTREIAISERWSAPLFDEPLEDLRRTIEQRMSAVLLAPSGTGKTLLLRALREQLPEARYRVQDVKLTSLSKRDLYREIALAAGVEPAGTYPTLMHRLQEHFRNQDQDDGRRPVLILDEGQDLRAEVLATLRLLTNYDIDSRPVLSVVLA